MELKLTTEEVSEKLGEFFRKNGVTNIPNEWDRFFASYKVAMWRWGDHVEGGYSRSNAMYVEVKYLIGVVLLISVRSGGAGWIPKDREYILNYLKPLIDLLGVGEPEKIWNKSVGAKSSSASVLNLRWSDGYSESLVDAIACVLES